MLPPKEAGGPPLVFAAKVFISADQAAQARFSRPTLTSLTSYLIYLLQCCSMSHLPLHCYTSSQTDWQHTQLGDGLRLSLQSGSIKKKKNERGEQSQQTSMHMCSAVNFAYTVGPNHICMYNFDKDVHSFFCIAYGLKKSHN